MTAMRQALAYREGKRHGDRAGLANAALQDLADGAASKKIALAVVLALALLRCYAAEVRVFAAASLTDSMKEVASAYEKESGEKIVFNFGASSMLARQIEDGAPADIFFSADEAKMDGLESKGLIQKGTRKDRISNSLVIVVATENGAAIRSPNDLVSANVKRVALGDPRAVPIGVYAREYLEKLKLWEVVRPKVVATENVRAALSAVEAGNADVSIVYKTDAAISKKVKVAFEVPLEEGPKISYPMAMVKDAREPAAAKKFFEYLSSDDAEKIFKRYGFIVIEPKER